MKLILTICVLFGMSFVYAEQVTVTIKRVDGGGGGKPYGCGVIQ